MSNWASPILVVPKKQDHVDAKNLQGSNNGKFNLQLCINYRKLNSHIQTACQIKANGSLGKVISNYPLLTIDSILAHFNGCKYFLTIDLRLGYYHIKLSREAAEKTALITDKGKWIFHSLPFGINISPSVFSYVLGGSCAVHDVFPELLWWHHGLLWDMEKSFKVSWGSVQMATGCRLGR